MIIPLDIEKAIDKIQHSHDKNIGESRDIRTDLTSHNKDDIQEATSC